MFTFLSCLYYISFIINIYTVQIVWNSQHTFSQHKLNTDLATPNIHPTQIMIHSYLSCLAAFVPLCRGLVSLSPVCPARGPRCQGRTGCGTTAPPCPPPSPPPLSTLGSPLPLLLLLPPLPPRCQAGGGHAALHSHPPPPSELPWCRPPVSRGLV